MDYITQRMTEDALTDETPEEESMVTVCSSCHQASCWQGQFYCDNYKWAGTVEMTRDDLRNLGLESPHYWGGGGS